MEKNKTRLMTFLQSLILLILILLIQRLMTSYALVHLQKTFYFISIIYSLLLISLIGQACYDIYCFCQRQQTLTFFLHIVLSLFSLFLLLFIAVQYQHYHSIVTGEIGNQARGHIIKAMPFLYLTAFLMFIHILVGLKSLFVKLLKLSYVKHILISVFVFCLLLFLINTMNHHIGLLLAKDLKVTFTGKNGAGEIASIEHQYLLKHYPDLAKTLTYSYIEKPLSNGELVTIQIHYDQQLAKKHHLFIHHTIKYVQVSGLITTYTITTLPPNLIAAFVTKADDVLLAHYSSDSTTTYHLIRHSLWYDQKQAILYAIYQVSYKNAYSHGGPFYCAVSSHAVDSTFLQTQHHYHHEQLILEDGRMVENAKDLTKVFNQWVKMLA